MRWMLESAPSLLLSEASFWMLRATSGWPAFELFNPVLPFEGARRIPATSVARAWMLRLGDCSAAALGLNDMAVDPNDAWRSRAGSVALGTPGGNCGTSPRLLGEIGDGESIRVGVVCVAVLAASSCFASTNASLGRRTGTGLYRKKLASSEVGVGGMLRIFWTRQNQRMPTRPRTRTAAPPTAPPTIAPRCDLEAWVAEEVVDGVADELDDVAVAEGVVLDESAVLDRGGIETEVVGIAGVPVAKAPTPVKETSKLG